MSRDEAFRVDDPRSRLRVRYFIGPDPFNYDEIVRGDHWDYRAISDGRVRGDPYVAVTDLAERIAGQDDYDYDVAEYYVEQHYDYPRFVCYDCHTYASYHYWDPVRLVLLPIPDRDLRRSGTITPIVTTAAGWSSCGRTVRVPATSSRTTIRATTTSLASRPVLEAIRTGLAMPIAPARMSGAGAGFLPRSLPARVMATDLMQVVGTDFQLATGPALNHRAARAPMINRPGTVLPTSRDVGRRPPLRISPGERVRTSALPLLHETPNRVAQLRRPLQLLRSHAARKRNRGRKRRGQSRRNSPREIGTRTRIRPAANPHHPRAPGSPSYAAGSLPDRSKPEIPLVRTALAGPRPYFLPKSISSTCEKTRMRRNLVLPFAFCLSLTAVPARYLFAQTSSPLVAAANTITPADVARRIGIIADDSMMGRNTPSPGLEMTAAYVADQFKKFGLKPGGENGTWFQRYRISRRKVDTAASSVGFTVQGKHPDVKLDRDARLAFGGSVDKDVGLQRS